MKHSIVFLLELLACLFSYNMAAQDIIVTQDGDVRKVYGVEVSESAVFYKTADTTDSPIQRIDKKDVLVIKYKDGTKKVFPDGGEVVTEKQQLAEPAAAGPLMVKPSDLSVDAASANTAALAQVNSPIDYKPEKSDEEAKRALMGFGVKSTSVLDDGNVKISIVQGKLVWQGKNKKPNFELIDRDFNLTLLDLADPSLKLVIQNKTNRAVYIDLGNSFYIRLGQSICYYVPSSTTTSSGSGSGVGVNMGSVAGALNIGGVAGQLASGVNIGGGKSSGVSSTTYAQRVVSISPMATYTLEPVFMFGDGAVRMCQGLENKVSGNAIIGVSSCYPSMNFSKKSAKGALKAGMHYAYTEENSPIELSNIITYSFSEDCSNARMLSVHMYLKDVMGVNTGKWSSNYKLKGDLSFQKNACFIFANVEDNNDEDFPRGTLVNDGVKSND